MRKGRLLRDSWNFCAVPWKLPCIVAGMPLCATAFSTAAAASESGTLGERLNEIVMAGNKPWWLTLKVVLVGSKCEKADSGTNWSSWLAT